MISDWIALNIVLLVGLPFIAFILGAGARLRTAWITFIVVFGLSWWGWIIYIALHFIAKYW